jgi:RNA polymerase sigma factor (sigma-70 family)
MTLPFWKPARPAPSTPSKVTFPEVYAQGFDTAHAVLDGKGVREDEMDDALQEVFVEAHKKLDDGTVPDNVKKWVAGIAFNVAARAGRRRARTAARFVSEADAVNDVAMATREDDGERIDPAVAALLWELVKKIPNEDHKDVVLRYYVGEQSIPEISAELRRPEGTVSYQLQRGRAFVEAQLRRRNVVPIFGVVGLFESLRHLKAPDDLRARVWDRLKDLPGGGVGGGGGSRPVAPAMPPAPLLAPVVAAASYGTTALGVVAVLGVLQGIVLGALWDPLHRTHGDVEARPETVAAAVTVAPRTAPAPNAAPSASAVASSMLVAPPGDRSEIDAEQVVLERGQAALRSGRVKEALDAIEKHAGRWHDRGGLTWKRERLRADLDRYIAEHPNDPQVIELRKPPKGTP